MTEQKPGSQLDLQNDPNAEPVSNSDATMPGETGAKVSPKSKPRLSLADRILIAALARVGHVLKPYPKDASGTDVTAALEALKDRTLIHYPAECPNLTTAGVVVARRLAADEG
jgi:hypothetical protein